MPFCPQCGSNNPDAARYCDQCGAALIPVVSRGTPVATPGPAVVPATKSATVVCPQCGTAAYPGEAFCDNCGAPLSAPSRSSSSVIGPQPVYPAPQPIHTPAAIPTPSTPAPPSAPVVVGRSQLLGIRLVVIATGAQVVVSAQTQAIIGRADPVSQFVPDVDLSSFGALEHGVGRRHARITLQGQQIMLEDLDSTNGTQVNGVKLAAHQPRSLANGDQVTFGRLALQILF